MGIDRFNNFILKYIDNNIIDDIDFKNIINIIASECIIIDTNFLIYQEITEIENEVNDIIKIILSLPSCDDNYISIEKYLKIILSQKHWQIYNFNDLLDGFNEDEIIIKFIKILTEKKNISTDEVLSLIELIIYEKILNKIIYIIDNLHYNNFIQTIALFFDGIPSLSKILEQRKKRIKNYLESNEKKKLYKLYFDNLEINNKKLINNLSKKYIDDNNNLYFDYIKWIKNRFTTNKSISPSSTFLINLEKYLKINLSDNYSKYKIYINSSKENGESDLKIFNYIFNNNNNYDYSIHTSDSDLIHQIMIQQTYYKIINKNINLNLIRYIKKMNNDYVQIIDANKLINNILESYNKVNNIKTNNYKIIWDLCYLFYFFGNDHLPSSIEIGPELGLDFFLKSHYKALNNNNIINLKKTYININLENLKLLLTTINETNEINKTRIILYRYFKINSYLITIFIDKFKLCFHEIIIFLKKFIIYRAVNLSDKDLNELDDLDMRKIYMKDVDNVDIYKDYSIFNLSEINLNILKENINLIEENIDYYEQKYNGLILYNKPIYISNDSYQDLYNYINDKAINNLSELYSLYYDYNNIEQHFNDTTSNVEEYLKKMYHLVYTQFGPMKQYYNNITVYKYYNVPKLSSIIDYLNNINLNTNKKWIKEFNNENVNEYLNSEMHYVLISPFLLNYNNINENYKNIKIINNLWINDINKFDYKNINFNDFIINWVESLKNNTSNKITDLIIIK